VRFPRATRQMVVRIEGKRMYLWRAVDHEGEILDVLVQRRRDRRAAVKLGRNRSGRVGQVYTILADALEPAPAERERRS